jgi:hypothetical protein
VVLSLSHDGACTDSFENFRESSLKGDPSNDITLNPPLFSLVNTLNNFENCRSLSKMKPCTMMGPEIGKKQKRFVMCKILTNK